MTDYCQKTLTETLEQIAALIESLPNAKENHPSLTFGVNAAMVDALAGIPGARVTATVFAGMPNGRGGLEADHVIESATVVYRGVELRVQRPHRPATEEERQELAARPRRHEPMVTADGKVAA